MTRSEVEKMVIDILRQIQSESGYDPPEVTKKSRPMNDLREFDSLNMMEFLVELEGRLGPGIDIEHHLFCKSGDKPPETVGGIVDFVMDVLKDEKESGK